ncbi:MAG: SCO family protein [Acidobacteria bacterium]|nr:SCO family protein [Acidobacteriota bacterium]
MTDINRRQMMMLLGAAPFASVLMGQETPQAKPPETGSKFQNVSSRERIRQCYFPNLSLTTHEGKKVLLYDDLIKDKIVLLNFMYVKCEGICMPITMNLRRVQDLLGDRMGSDIFINSFTLKPLEDTVDSLKHYAEMHHIKPGWNFVTGSAADMESIRRKLGYADPDPELDKDLSQHIGVIKYGNEPLERWGGTPGMRSAAYIVKSISWVDWPEGMKKPSGA